VPKFEDGNACNEACVALAREVMNKDWLFWLVFLAFLTVGLIGMWVCQRRPTMVVLNLLLVALAAGTQMITLNHVYADETISARAGLRYVVLSYVAIVSSFILIIVGTLQGRRRRRLGVAAR